MIRRLLCHNLLAACVLNLTSCGMSVNGINVGKIADLSTNIAKSATTNQAEELLLGDQLAAMLLGASKLHESSQWQHYVNQVGRYLANYSNRPDLPWTFAVLDTPDINAFAVPGGYVFVTSGLLSLLQSEAELAAVLSHEIIHIDQRHQLVEMERQNKLEIFKPSAVSLLNIKQQQVKPRLDRPCKTNELHRAYSGSATRFIPKG